jgi:hypothetical protein
MSFWTIFTNFTWRGIFYLQCLVLKEHVGAKSEVCCVHWTPHFLVDLVKDIFGEEITGLYSPSVIMLLTVPRRRHSVSSDVCLLFHTITVTLVSLFLVYGKNRRSPSPWPSIPLSQQPFTCVGLLLNRPFNFIVGVYYFLLCVILVIAPSVFSFLPCPVFVWVLLGYLSVFLCWLVVWGLHSLNAALPCSCFSYFSLHTKINWTV